MEGRKGNWAKFNGSPRERRWLASLLGDEQAVAPFLKFLKATGIGVREGAKERELEWERKNDREGEDLLG